MAVLAYSMKREKKAMLCRHVEARCHLPAPRSRRWPTVRVSQEPYPLKPTEIDFNIVSYNTHCIWERIVQSLDSTLAAPSYLPLQVLAGLSISYQSASKIAEWHHCLETCTSHVTYIASKQLQVD